MLSKIHGRTIAELAEEQILKWEKLTARGPNKDRKPVIAISRQEGTLAEEVAPRLADVLHMHLYDGEIVQHIAENAHVTERMVRSLDEHGRSYMFDFIEGLQGRIRFSSDKYFDALLKTLGTIHYHGNGVIVGRGSAFALDGPRDLRVRFVAPLEVRIRRLREKEGLTESEAKKRIHQSDKDHAAFASSYFDLDIDDPQNFDLIVNDAFVDVETAVNMLACAAQVRQGLSVCTDETGGK